MNRPGSAKETPFDLLIYGELCAFDLCLAEHLSRKGLKVQVARDPDRADKEKMTVPDGYFRRFDPGSIVYFHHPRQLICLMRQAKLAITLTGSLGFALGWRWLLRKFLHFPPVVNISTGSDFSELLDDPGKTGAAYRQMIRAYHYNLIPPYPHVLKNVFKYRIHNAALIRYPCYYLPESQGKEDLPRQGRLKFFHPSHLDFKITDPGARRNSSKGNDRFLRAFMQVLENGLDAECVILDRGPDREIARNLVAKSPFADRFLWKSHLSREELIREYEMADVVVDQFDVGGLGGIALEAMAMAKPVLAYLHEHCIGLLHSEFPPVLNAQTENDITRQILRHADREILRETGKRARQWVLQNYSWEACTDQFLFYYTLLTGHRVIDYGWEKDPYSG